MSSLSKAFGCLFLVALPVGCKTQSSANSVKTATPGSPACGPGLWIHGGCEAAAGSNAAQSAVGLFMEDSRGGCGAARIGENYLITAAHCLVEPAEASKLKLAYLTASSTAPGTSATFAYADATVVAQIGFPKADGEAPFDLGLIVFKANGASDAFSGAVPVATIAPFSGPDGTDLINSGTVLEKAGFGAITDQQEKDLDSSAKAKLVPVTLNVANLTVKTVDKGNAEIIYTTINDTPSATAGTCNGDSGGPAFISTSGQRLLVGVTDRGPKEGGEEMTCSQNNGIDEDIRFYRNWVNGIDQQLHDLAATNAELASFATVPSLNLDSQPGDNSGTFKDQTVVLTTAQALAIAQSCSDTQEFDVVLGKCVKACGDSGSYQRSTDSCLKE